MLTILLPLLVATPPSVDVPIAAACPAERGCLVVLLEVLETPPTKPIRTNEGKFDRFAAPRSDDDEYTFTAACAPGLGTYLAIQKKRGKIRSNVRVLNTKHDPFVVELDGPFLRRDCLMFPFSSVKQNRCPEGMPCVGDVPAKGTRFIAMIFKKSPSEPWRLRPANWKQAVRLPTGEVIHSYIAATETMIDALSK